jgi:hypothetical protein
LTNADISRWLVEGPSGKPEEHLRDCRSCRAKLAEASAPLTVFRSGVVAWSEAQTATEMARRVELKGRSGIWSWAPAFGLSFAMALLVAAIAGPPVYRWEVQRHAVHPQVSDAALMEQVDAEVSEAVPDAMAPLTDLVAWDSEESAAAPAKQVVKRKPAVAVKRKKEVAE